MAKVKIEKILDEIDLGKYGEWYINECYCAEEIYCFDDYAEKEATHPGFDEFDDEDEFYENEYCDIFNDLEDHERSINEYFVFACLLYDKGITEIEECIVNDVFGFVQDSLFIDFEELSKACDDAIKEHGWDGCGGELYKAGQMAEFRLIEKCGI